MVLVFGHISLFYINIAVCILPFMDVDRPCFLNIYQLSYEVDIIYKNEKEYQSTEPCGTPDQMFIQIVYRS